MTVDSGLRLAVVDATRRAIFAERLAAGARFTVVEPLLSASSIW